MRGRAAQLDREIAQILERSTARRSEARVGHAVKATEKPRRWIHRDVARTHSVPENVVRRIYSAVQTAKRQGLYGGYMADLVERSVGRKLVGAEYTVYARAKEHLGYDPPSGYGGPRPTGSAKEPPRAKYDDPKIERAAWIAAQANRAINNVINRRKGNDPQFWWTDKGRFTSSSDSKDRALLRQAADELDVAADLYEEAGAGVRAGTLHERARHARQGDYRLLTAYE